MAMFYNVNRGRGNPAKTGKEIIPLSIDKTETKNKEVPSKDILGQFKKKIKDV